MKKTMKKHNLKKLVAIAVLCVVFLGALFSKSDITTVSAYSPLPQINDFYNSSSKFYKLKINRIYDTVYYSREGDIESILGVPEGVPSHQIVYNQFMGTKIVKYIMLECEVVDELWHGNKDEELILMPICITVDRTVTITEDGFKEEPGRYLDFESVKSFFESCDMLYYGVGNRSWHWTLYTFDGEIRTTEVNRVPELSYYSAQIFPIINQKVSTFSMNKLYFGQITGGLSYGVEDYLYDGLSEAEADENIKRLYEDVLEYERLEAERIAEAERKANRSFPEVIFEFFIEIFKKIFEFFVKIFQKIAI